MRIGWVLVFGLLTLSGILMAIYEGIHMGGGVLTMVGGMLVWICGFFTIVGFIAKPEPNMSIVEDMRDAITEGAYVPLVLVGLVLVAYGFVIQSPIVVLGFILFVFLSLFVVLGRVVKFFHNFLGFVYGEVQPETLPSKIVTAIFSILFGLFVLYLLYAITDIIVSIVIGVLTMFLAMIIIRKLKGR